MFWLLELLGSALWFIFPAYVANASPVVFGGGKPLDFGKNFVDGKRVFGDGKTIRGFFCGVAAGIVFGLIQGAITGSFQHYLPLACLLSLGALLGDLLGSFIKRRIGIERGGAAPVLDQLGFVCPAMLLAWPFYLPGWQEILTIVIITPPIHLATNFAGYKLGMKSHPY